MAINVMIFIAILFCTYILLIKIVKIYIHLKVCLCLFTETELLEAATGAMRAIIDRLRQDQCEILGSITQDALKVGAIESVSKTNESRKGSYHFPHRT